MTEQEKLGLLEETLEVDEGSLTPDMHLDDIDEFNSMAVLSLIVMFEDEFDKKITGKEIKTFTSVSEILNRMELKL
ncbi:MAG: acyl carrier protein [Eubacterium sp.]|jgi:acyl carrier protein|nr:acyl carrier protein [Eubacterium sp.]